MAVAAGEEAEGSCGGCSGTAPEAAQLGQSAPAVALPVPSGAVLLGIAAVLSEAAVGVSSSSTGRGGAWGHRPAPPREPGAGRRPVDRRCGQVYAATRDRHVWCAAGRGALYNTFIYPCSPTPTILTYITPSVPSANLRTHPKLV